jgi:hypothetical protein
MTTSKGSRDKLCPSGIGRPARVSAKEDPYQPTSAVEWNSVVILGAAVPMMLWKSLVSLEHVMRRVNSLLGEALRHDTLMTGHTHHVKGALG